MTNTVTEKCRKKKREEGKQKAQRERKGLLGVVKKLWD